MHLRPSLVGVLAGGIADRVNRRHLLIALNLVSALVMLALLGVHGRDTVWIVFAAMTWYGLDLVVFSAAENALFAEMLPLEFRQHLNGWNLGLQEAGRLVAPLFGAGLFAVIGGASVAAFDSATFVVAAAVTTGITFRQKESPAHRSTHIWAGLAAGFGHIRRTPELLRLLIAGAVVVGVSGVVLPAQYSLVQALGEPPSFLGALAAALGAGSIAASMLSARIVRSIGEPWLAVAGTLDYALGSILRATGVLPLAIAGSLVFGFALPWAYLALLSLSQRRTPLHLQGRVSVSPASMRSNIVTLGYFVSRSLETSIRS